MADTDKDTPWKLWAHYGLHYDDPVRCFRFGRRSRTGWTVRYMNRQDRFAVRAALRRGDEPEPRQPRNRAKRDAM